MSKLRLFLHIIYFTANVNSSEDKSHHNINYHRFGLDSRGKYKGNGFGYGTTIDFQLYRV
jgi:hypothetical protein